MRWVERRTEHLAYVIVAEFVRGQAVCCLLAGFPGPMTGVGGFNGPVGGHALVAHLGWSPTGDQKRGIGLSTD